jgi:transposase
MNRLNVSLQSSILALHDRGWSRRKIARELQLDRATVRRHVLAANAAISTPGSAEESTPKAAISTPGSTAGRASLCHEYLDVITAGLSAGLSAKRIHQDLAGEHGFAGSYQSVKRCVRQLAARLQLPVRRLESPPGEELQVDFGQGAWIIEEQGKRRRPHLFRAVLSHSRKGYSEVVWRQDTETFIRCLENAFRFIGGVTRTVVPDNLKAAVLQADWFEAELNPKLREFAAHYGTVILPTRPARPEHKGKVEAGVDYVQENALKARTFPSLAAQNLFLSEWERTVADTRIHGTVRQQVAARFELERPALLPLPASLFPSFIEGRRRVHRDGHVEFGKAYYSVPPEYVGRDVWVRADVRLLRVHNQRMDVVAAHARVDPGRFATAAEHIHAHKRCGLERGAEYWLQRCRLIGPHTGAWAEGFFAQRGIYGLRAVQGLVSLAQKHPAAALERAAGIAVHRGVWRLRDLRTLLDQQNDSIVQVDFLETHPLIRDLAAYKIDAFSHP